jgi:hypothetical protein
MSGGVGPEGDPVPPNEPAFRRRSWHFARAAQICAGAMLPDRRGDAAVGPGRQPLMFRAMEAVVLSHFACASLRALSAFCRSDVPT